MMVILNFMAWNLMTQMLFAVSATFSILYFISSIGRIIRIVWNHYRPDEEWGKRESHDRWNKQVWSLVKQNPLFKMIIIFGIILVLLVLVFPIFRI